MIVYRLHLFVLVLMCSGFFKYSVKEFLGMFLLEIGNSTSRISGLNSAQMASLRGILSYSLDKQALYFSQNFRNSRKYLVDSKGNFPTGLLYLVKEYLASICNNQTVGNYVTVRDLRTVPKSVKFASIRLDFTPYPEQIEAADTCAKAHRGIVSMPTGSGKSAVISLIINKLQVRTLVVVPSLELKAQLSSILAKCFGADAVGKDKPIWVENVQAFDANEVILDRDCLILDEFHHSGAKTYRMLNKKSWQNIYYRFGLTATPWRSNTDEQLLLESVLSKVIYSITYETAVKKQYVLPIEAYYIEVPTTKDVKGCTWAQVYSELVVNHKQRNEIISKLLLFLHTNGLPTLCLVKEIAHGRGILKYIPRSINSDDIPFANGLDDLTNSMIRGFNSGTFKTLVGTVGVLGEGVDTKPAEYVIIAGLGKSRGQFMQAVGRVLRINPGKASAKVIIFKDKSHKWTLSHWREQMKILREEYSAEAVKLGMK